MTPLKNIAILDTSVFTQDHAGTFEFMCECPDLDRAKWVASSLARANGVEVVTVKFVEDGPADLRMGV